MEKRAKINLFFSIVAVMLLTFLFVPGQVRAEDQNVVQLDFTNCSEIDTDAGRVTYEIEGAKYRISMNTVSSPPLSRVSDTSSKCRFFGETLILIISLSLISSPDLILTLPRCRTLISAAFSLSIL